MKFLYNLGIYLYQFGLRCAAPFHAKARAWVRGRRGLFDRIKSDLQTDSQVDTAWFHAASLGEFEQGRPVIEAFRGRYPGYRIVLTFFSPSGYEIRKHYAGADFVYYLPADTPANARQFIDLVCPKVAFFIKYEFWHNYLSQLHTQQVPAFCISAIFRADQVFFGTSIGRAHQPLFFSWNRFFQGTLRNFTHHFVQNQESVRLLNGIGINNTTLAGDTRFDRVHQLAEVRQVVRLVADFCHAQQVLVVGSAWDADLKVLIPFLNCFTKPLKVIVAPHEIQAEEIGRWQKQLHAKSIKYSEVVQNQAIETDVRVLFIDNIGLLSSLYQYAQFAYIGGGFGKGLHNILEAATFGLPLFFGNKNYQKFQEANDLIAAGGAFLVEDTPEFTQLFGALYQDKTRQQNLRAANQAYVESRTGATQIILDLAGRWL